MAKVSVIIPIYNAQKYLSQCLDSILNQTLDDIEIICVDDGSTDGSVDIVNEYAKKDSRIALIKQNNLYAGVARNNGMSKATGEYLIFLDADDFFEKDMLRAMYEKCVQDNAQVCLCSGRTYDENSDEFKPANHYLEIGFLPEKTPFSAMDAADKIFLATAPAPWTKMFKRSYIIENQFEFQPLKKTNDLFFVYCAIACATSITYVNECFVNYRIGNDQSLQGITTELSFDFYDAIFALKKELQKRKIFQYFEKGFVNRALLSCFYNLDRINVKENYIAVADMLREEGFYKLNVLGHSRGYFFYKSFFIRLLDFMGKTSEELWLEKTAPVPEKKTAKINIDQWESPIEITSDGDVKVSVIIPVYNVEQYLKECVDSVAGNTFKDIEMICVNDGSTDNSAEILNQLAEGDSRIRIITKENGGLSSARNAGIKAAKGEYLYFIDSDDYIDPRTLEYLYSEAKAADLDQLFFSARVFCEEGCEQPSSRMDYYERKTDYNGVMTGREFFIKMSENADFKPSACLQIIRRDFLIKNNLWFIEGLFYEDNPFTIQCLFHSKRVRFDNIDLYNRRMREKSIITSSAGLKSSYAYFLVLKAIERIAEENDFGSDRDFYKALMIQLRRTLFLSADYANEATEDEIMDFVAGLDEKDGLDYYFSVKVASEHRKRLKEFSRRVRDLNEKNVMDSYVYRFKEKELDSYVQKCREYEEQKKETERLRKAERKTFKGRTRTVLGLDPKY